MRILIAATLISVAAASIAAAAPIEILSGPPPADAPEVKIETARFSAPEVRVKPGASVKWINVDGATHNVHFRRGPAKGQPNAQGRTLNAGDVYVVKFSQAGTYEYIDTLNSTMKGKVIVE